METPGMDTSREEQSMATTREIAIPDTSTETARTTDSEPGRDQRDIPH